MTSIRRRINFKKICEHKIKIFQIKLFSYQNLASAHFSVLIRCKRRPAEEKCPRSCALNLLWEHLVRKAEDRRKCFLKHPCCYIVFVIKNLIILRMQRVRAIFSDSSRKLNWMLQLHFYFNIFPASVGSNSRAFDKKNGNRNILWNEELLSCDVSWNYNDAIVYKWSEKMCQHIALH